MDLWMVLSVAAPLVGALAFCGLASGVRAHLRGLGDFIRFFFLPFGPDLMVVIKRLDGSFLVAYGHELRVQRSSRATLMDLGGEQFVTEDDPYSSGTLVSIADARAPIGYPSPFGLAWRCLMSWMIALCIEWIALSVDVVPSLPAIQRPEQWIELTMFVATLFTLFGSIMVRIYMPQTIYTAYIETGIEPPYSRVVAGCDAFSPTPIDRCVERLGGRVVINVPSSVKEFLEALARKIGSYALASAILALLDMVPTLRKSIAELRREQRTVKEMARELVAAEFYRYLSRPTLGKVLFWIFLFALGLVVGYVIGSSWAVSTTPPPWLNATATHHAAHTITPASPPTLATHRVTITPATPPTPPATATSTTASSTVTPATAPPPR